MQAQQTDSLTTSKQTIKIMDAVKVERPPRIDGDLTDEAWSAASYISGFRTFEPEVGKTPAQKTDVKVVYDNSAIYVAAYLHDDEPNTILRELGTRDAIRANADYFGVFFDTYHDRQNGFGFVVSASNIQSDARYSSQGEDWNWNSAWFSKARIVEDGWIVEMRIPYTAIRFSEKETQNWGINFMRQIRRLRQRAMWADFDPAQDGFVNQFGLLRGLQGIEPPLRLSVTPYVSAYADSYRDKSEPANNSNSYSFKGGMDLKYGINESFTLDMVLIPDFGQVQSDDQILNLGPFEVFFNENRPFFTEGVELFGRGNIFYSRRVGGTPVNFYDVEDQLTDGEEIVNNPTETQLYNASKISGRTANGVGLGLFNAVVGNTYATVADSLGNERKVLTNPLTNYNILVFEKTLKNASYVSFINTNVWREGSFRDANVTATEFRFANKNQSYSVNGSFSVSQLFDRAAYENHPHLGFKYFVEGGKVSGKFKATLWQNVESDTYNPNDLGFLRNPNEFTNGLTLRYNEFNPFWGIFNNFFSRLNFRHEMLYKPMAFSGFQIQGNFGATFKNFTTSGVFFSLNPIQGKDFFEPRAEDRFSVRSNFYFGGLFISTDYRKNFAFDIETGYGAGSLYNPSEYFVRISPRLRVNDRLSFIYNANIIKNPVDVGYAHTLDNDSDDIIYGSRKRNTVINTLTARYIFTSRMGLNLRVRHYWSRVLYDKFHLLQMDGYLADTDYTGDHNSSFSAFNIDLVYNWEFTPGSQLSVVWKSSISDFQNIDSGLTNYERIETGSYFNNLNDIFDAPQRNSLSVRLLYFLDYQEVFKRNKNRG